MPSRTSFRRRLASGLRASRACWSRIATRISNSLITGSHRLFPEKPIIAAIVEPKPSARNFPEALTSWIVAEFRYFGDFASAACALPPFKCAARNALASTHAAPAFFSS